MRPSTNAITARSSSPHLVGCTARALLGLGSSLPRQTSAEPRAAPGGRIHRCRPSPGWHRLTLQTKKEGRCPRAGRLGSTLWDFGRGNIDRTRAFVDDYRRHDGPIERLDASVFNMARVVQANLISFHGGRAVDPAGSPKRHERAERALRAILARPLTKQLVDEMIGVPS
jgi:hypothetical protein